MTKRMLIDAAHPEETRVVVLDGTRLIEFDYETSTKKQIKGNIYLAKVTRVEPSLQAAFVEYGGNRHGFLAFNEIHPDYYRIPVADREAALEADREAEADANAREAEREETGGEFLAETMAHDAPAEEMHGPPTEQPEFHADETEPPDEPDFHASSVDSSAGPASEAGHETEHADIQSDAAAPAVRARFIPPRPARSFPRPAKVPGTTAPPTARSRPSRRPPSRRSAATRWRRHAARCGGRSGTIKSKR